MLWVRWWRGWWHGYDWRLVGLVILSFNSHRGCDWCLDWLVGLLWVCQVFSGYLVGFILFVFFFFLGFWFQWDFVGQRVVVAWWAWRCRGGHCLFSCGRCQRLREKERKRKRKREIVNIYIYIYIYINKIGKKIEFWDVGCIVKLYDIVCICLHFQEPKTPIIQKTKEKMCLAHPKTQLFGKSYVLGSGKKRVQNAQNLWTTRGP